jgi:hypothetical protein
MECHVFMIRVNLVDRRGGAFLSGFTSYASSRVVPTVLGLVLLVAALLKTQQAATEEMSEVSVLSSRWFIAMLVLFEIGLGVLMISGFEAQNARLIALGTFLIFFEISLYQSTMGYNTCGCLGKASLNPWYTTIFDLAAIVSLIAWRPLENGSRLFAHPVSLVAVAVVFVCLAGPALLNIIYYAPGGIMYSLRNDPQLQKHVYLDLATSTPEEILGSLKEQAGLSLTLASPLQSQELDLGEIHVKGAPAFALMEFLNRKFNTPTRWEKLDGGYELRTAAPFGSMWRPWLVSAATLVVAVVCWQFLQKGQRDLSHNSTRKENP